MNSMKAQSDTHNKPIKQVLPRWAFALFGSLWALVSVQVSHAQCTNANTLIIPANANWQPLVSTPPNLWTNNYPPASATGACTACPTLYTTSVCEGNRIPIYMCTSSVYTISLCNSTNTAWNSYLTLTNAAGSVSYIWDDNSCGGLLSTFTFNPSINGTYFIRVSGPPPICGLNTLACGTIEITCSPVPPPPTNDNPCNATVLPVGPNCVATPTGTTWATATSGIGSPSCGVYPNNADVWYSAVVPPSGNLAIETALVGATNIAMALYTAPNCTAPAASWIQVVCNADIAAGSLEPFILQTGLTVGSTVYIRVWPEGNILNGGSFEICAYDPIVPTNDQPCNATPMVVDAACTPISATNQNATPTTGSTFSPVNPTCGNVAPLRDVWFTLTTPVVPITPSVGVVINMPTSNLTDPAMAVYTGTCNGTLTQIACSDPAGAGTPSITLVPPGVPQGTTLYIRVWNKTTVFGTFTICAKPTSPPPNDDPCGAVALVPQYGCLFIGSTLENATQTPTSPAGTVNVPGTSCGGTPANDVWFSAVVPPNGQLLFDTDDGGLTDAAIEVYRVVTGSCAGNNLNLAQVGACAVAGSTNGPNMPALNVLTGLTPGQTVYIRVWRQSGAASSFSICTSRTDPPPGTCVFTLRMRDSAGDGWNGSTVEVRRYPGGVGPPISTPYTIIGANGSISFSAEPGDIIELFYTPVGGFQNQISFTLSSPSGGLIFSSASPPPAGINDIFNVDNVCNDPPAPQEDCIGAVQVCNDATLNATPQNTGAVQDLNVGNRGCLITNERQGVWYSFFINNSGRLGFSVGPGNTDYDYGVWGPFVPNFTCPPTAPPIRCSWADGAAVTGLNYTATDLTEGVFGDGWTRYLDVVAGQWYTLFLDNWYLTGAGFTMNWDLRDGASISCSVTPVELVDLYATVTPQGVSIDWITATERNVEHFVVERAIDEQHFEAIAQVRAVGESQTTQAYRTVDTAPHKGSNRYRLLIVDKDGSSSYSRTVEVLFEGNPTTLHIRPNPVVDQMVLDHFAEKDGLAKFIILDNAGRAVSESSSPLAEGWNRIEVPLTHLVSGAYQIVLFEENGVRTTGRFVKQ